MAAPEGLKQNPDMPELFGTFNYEGVTMPTLVVKSSLDELKTFDVRPDDIWLCTFPKSGTHFGLEMTSLILAGGDPEKVDRSTHLSTICMINMDRPFTIDKDGDAPTGPDTPVQPYIDVIRNAPSPRVIGTHLPIQLLPPNLEKRAKVIYVARNPKDVALSMMRFTEKTTLYPGGFHQFLIDMMNGDTMFGSWSDHVLGFWKKRNEENVIFLTFEDMKKNMPEIVPRVAKLLGRTLSPEQQASVVKGSGFDAMVKTYDKLEKESEQGKFLTRAAGQMPFLNKGKVGSWKERFTVAQNEVFDKWIEETFAGSGLKFEF